MSYEGFEPVIVDTLGGLCTLMARSDLPVGLSPDCVNIEFYVGGIRTRAGTNAAKSFAATTDFTFVKEFRKDQKQFLVTCDKTGTLCYSISPYASIASTLLGDLNTIQAYGSVVDDYKRFVAPMMTVAFGRAWITFPWLDGDPTQWIGGVGQHQYFLTGDTTADKNARPISVTAPGQSPTAANTGAAGSGNISPGPHCVAVAFENEYGYITPLSNASLTIGQWVANGTTPGVDTFKVRLDNIPIGPPGTVARIIYFTPVYDTTVILAGTNNDFYTLPRFRIENNSLIGTLDLDFTDDELLGSRSSVLDQGIHLRYSPPPRSIVTAYANRLVLARGPAAIPPLRYPPNAILDWQLGDDGVPISGVPHLTATLNKVPPGNYLSNLDFNGGSLSTTDPCGWTRPAMPTGDIYVNTENDLRGVPAAGGKTKWILQMKSPAVPAAGDCRIDNDGWFVGQANERYTVFVRMLAETGIAAGELRCFTYTAATASGVLTLAPVPKDTWFVTRFIMPANTPMDRLGFDLNTVTTGKSVFIDNIWITKSNDYADEETLMVSEPGTPEVFNIATGIVSSLIQDGQSVQALFEIRGNLYLAKERSTWVTVNNGREPAEWPIEKVSDTMGACSPHSVAMGDGWAIVVGVNGAFIFGGGAPDKLSQEIEPTWKGINWSAGQRIRVLNDPQARRIYVHVPWGSSAIANRTLVLDYVEGFGDPIAGQGHGRKWAWMDQTHTIAADTNLHGVLSTDFVYGPTQTGTVFMALDSTLAGLAAGTIVKLDSTIHLDMGGVMACYYDTAPIGAEIGRSRFGGITMKVEGSGTIEPIWVRPNGAVAATLTKTLASPALHDIEIKQNRIETQLGLRIKVSDSGEWYNLRRLAVWTKPEPFARLRGHNL